MLSQNAGRPNWGIKVSKFAVLVVPHCLRNEEQVCHCPALGGKEKLGAEGILVGTRDSFGKMSRIKSTSPLRWSSRDVLSTSCSTAAVLA